MTDREEAKKDILLVLIRMEDQARRDFIQSERHGDKEYLHFIADAVDSIQDMETT